MILFSIAIIILSISIVFFTLKAPEKSRPAISNSVLDFIDITETDDKYLLKSTCKGFSAKDLSVNVNNKYIVITGKIVMTNDGFVKEAESVEKSWLIPDNANIQSLNVSIKKDTVNIILSKK